MNFVPIKTAKATVKTTPERRLKYLLLRLVCWLCAKQTWSMSAGRTAP